MTHLTCEYEDAVQRARRLAACREMVLTGRGNTAHLLTPDDVVIYLRWLVCHLHSAHTIHNFIRVKQTYSLYLLVLLQYVILNVFFIIINQVLHYIPVCERPKEDSNPTVAKARDKPQYAGGK